MVKLDISFEVKVLGSSAIGMPELALLDGACLFLDFDGTLIEIASHPDAIMIDQHLRVLLANLALKLEGRLGIISGRSISQLQQYLGPLPLIYAGSHGAEIHWPDGRRIAPAEAGDLDLVVREIMLFKERHPGIIVERKAFGVAIHYRGVPQYESACRQLAMTLAQSSELVVQSGKMVFELRAAGPDKGDALRTLAGSVEMKETRPIFIGDDDTDEAAFVAAAELGGAGILVGPPRPTAALFGLDDVSATLAWLTAACAVPR